MGEGGGGKWGYKTDNIIFAGNKDYAYMCVDIPGYCILLSHSSVPFILPKIKLMLIPYDALIDFITAYIKQSLYFIWVFIHLNANSTIEQSQNKRKEWLKIFMMANQRINYNLWRQSQRYACLYLLISRL